MELNENKIAEIILDCCFKIHRALGPGLFESVYEEVLCYELSLKKIHYIRQQIIPVWYENIKMEMGFRADLIVEGMVIVELKSIESLASVHAKQVITYLKLTDIRLGLLLNFNEALFKNGIKRIVNQL